MAWFRRETEAEKHVRLSRELDELDFKLNPAQAYIAQADGAYIDTRENIDNYRSQYEQLEMVYRAVNMIIDDASNIAVKVGSSVPDIIAAQKTIRAKKLSVLLNKQPNPFEDISTFKRKILTDLITEGNIFIYFDGAFLYHLPAKSVIIKPDDKTKIASYIYDSRLEYSPNEIIHVKENSLYDTFRGVPRLKAAYRTMKLVSSMRSYQDNFFEKGAVTGLVLKTENTLSQRIKDRLLASWASLYNPRTGGGRPMILDGGMEIDSLSKTNFKDLDFESSIPNNLEMVLNGIGVPALLLKGGNNVNIRPNLRLYYLETILPIVHKINAALEVFFGYEITEDVTNVPALQPELRDQAAFVSTLVNGGIMTPNEGRRIVGLDDLDDEGANEIRIPANIAGSAADPSQGGRPTEDEDD